MTANNDKDGSISEEGVEAQRTKLNEKSKPPSWLDSGQSSAWRVLPHWRLAFQSQESFVRKRLLFYSLRTNGLALAVSLLITGFVVFVLPLVWESMPQLHVTTSVLFSVASLCVIVVASLIAIVLAFVTFLFGNARFREEQARDGVRHDIQTLESVEREIADFVHGYVKGNPEEPLGSKLQKLIDTANEFHRSINRVIGRFSRAARGTFYPEEDVIKLNMDITLKEGEWFVAFGNVFWSREDRDLSRRISDKVHDASSSLYRRNEEIRLAEDQLQQSVEIALILPSLVGVFLFALVVILMTNTIFVDLRIPDFITILLIVLLFALLGTHVWRLVRWIVQLIWRTTIISGTNREVDRALSKRIEQMSAEEVEKFAAAIYPTIFKGNT